VREISAEWVLPVDGPPIEGGLVRYENGVIVEVTRGRAARHFPEAAILPGFVNAHSHLEYAVYAGFGDGMAFGPWIRVHVDRKGRLDAEQMLDAPRLYMATDADPLADRGNKHDICANGSIMIAGSEAVLLIRLSRLRHERHHLLCRAAKRRAVWRAGVRLRKNRRGNVHRDFPLAA